jgi:hypothetical protein
MFDFLLCWECALLVGLRAKPAVPQKKRAQAKKQEVPLNFCQRVRLEILLVR